MAAAFVDDVVSPELALVDPELAARARKALPDAVAVERSFAIGFEFVPEELLPDDAVMRRRRAVVPLALGSLVAVSIIGAGLLRGGPAPDVGESWSASGAAPVVASGGSSSPATEASSFAPGVATDATNPVARMAAPDQLQSQTVDSSSLTRAPSLASGDAVAPMVAARATELVWDGLGTASSYDIELIRNGSQIFSASSPSPAVNVPRSWTHDGERFSVRPEDEVFIWPVVDGRRGSRPLVDGTHVFDNTLIARFTG